MSSEDSESQPFYVGRIPKALSDELHCHQRHVELSLTWILFYTCVSLSSNTVFTNELKLAKPNRLKVVRYLLLA